MKERPGKINVNIHYLEQAAIGKDLAIINGITIVS